MYSDFKDRYCFKTKPCKIMREYKKNLYRKLISLYYKIDYSITRSIWWPIIKRLIILSPEHRICLFMINVRNVNTIFNNYFSPPPHYVHKTRHNLYGIFTLPKCDRYCAEKKIYSTTRQTNPKAFAVSISSKMKIIVLYA